MRSGTEKRAEVEAESGDIIMADSRNASRVMAHAMARRLRAEVICGAERRCVGIMC